MTVRRRQISTILAVCAAIGAYACKSSPTAPAPSTVGATGLTVTFLDPTSLLSGDQELIRRHIQETFDLASQEISLDGLKVDVTPQPRYVVPGWGVGGKALGSYRVELGVDPGVSRQLIDERLPSIVAHELHHVARFRGPGYGDTLLQAMVSEGMADHYALELLGHPPPPWVTSLSPADIPKWLEHARSEFDSSGYEHALWFFGVGWVPNWAGYAMGFELIARYKETHPGSSAATLVNADANAFRP